MKFGYKFSNLLGTIYREGDILFSKDGNTVICPVGNKISMYDLANNRSITLPVEARFNYSALALSPSGNILLAALERELHVINLNFKSIVYRKMMQGNILHMKFSPNEKHFAISIGKTVFVYRSPTYNKRIYNPFCLDKVIDSAFDDVLCFDWSHDSRLISVGSNDMSVHVCAFTKFTNLRNYNIGGHSDSIMGVYFQEKSYDLCTVSKNAHVNVWTFDEGEHPLCLVTDKKLNLKPEEDIDHEDELSNKETKTTTDSEPPRKQTIVYRRKTRLYLKDLMGKGNSCTVTSVSYKKESKLLVAGFASGDFLLLDMTDSGSLIHSLNVSQKSISSTCINASGDWIALGVSSTGELLVWEWQSETHVLKQQGHFNSMRVVCYSPDGLHIASGGDDGKVKLWSTQTSFCFVTFSEHTSAITGITFTQSGKAILSSSLDGTVRAFDMIRYRNFKTLTSHKPAQFSCLSVDSSGELVVAGAQDSHDIFLWSLQTGKLLEILGGHTGPVVSLQFSSQLGSSKLVSTAWDKSVKVWDAIANTTAKETIPLLAEGMCVAFREDGEQFAVASMNGHITMFNATTFRQEGNIEGKNDLGAGRQTADKITAESNSKSKCFTTMSYSPDGKFILVAGQSKNVCIYSVEDELLIKKFEVTQNRSFDAMDKVISRRKLAENGVNLDLVEMRSEERGLKVPGCARGSLSERTFSPEVRVSSLAFSRTGRSWAASTTEGLLVYSLDDDWLFDPLHLEEANTPEAVRRKLKGKHYSTALMMACRLNMKSLTQEVLESIPFKSICVVVGSLTQIYVESLIKILPEILETSRHIGFYSYWVTSLTTTHGQMLKERAPNLIADLSGLQKSLTTHYDNLSKVCGHNEYTLTYILSQGELRRKMKAQVKPALKWEDDLTSEEDSSTSEQGSEDEVKIEEEEEEVE